MVPERLGLVVAGSWMQSSRFDRSDPTRVFANQASLFAHLVYTPAPRTTLRTVGHGQRVEFPATNRGVWQQPGAAERDRSMHVQSTLERLGGAISGALLARTRRVSASPRYGSPPQSSPSG